MRSHEWGEGLLTENHPRLVTENHARDSYKWLLFGKVEADGEGGQLIMRLSV